MPSTTAWGLPYPVIGDQADVPGDMGELAEAVDGALTELSADVAAVPRPDPSAVTAWRMAAGRATMPTAPAGNSGVTVAVTLPAGRFTVPPIVTALAVSNGYGAASAGAPTTTSFSCRYYNPTGSTPSSPTVHWIAVQMTTSKAVG